MKYLQSFNSNEPLFKQVPRLVSEPVDFSKRDREQIREVCADLLVDYNISFNQPHISWVRWTLNRGSVGYDIMNGCSKYGSKRDVELFFSKNDDDYLSVRAEFTYYYIDASNTILGWQKHGHLTRYYLCDSVEGLTQLIVYLNKQA